MTVNKSSASVDSNIEKNNQTIQIQIGTDRERRTLTVTLRTQHDCFGFRRRRVPQIYILCFLCVLYYIIVQLCVWGR
jgi:hypothetical protein